VDKMDQLLHVDKEEYLKEAEELENYFYLFGDRLPKGIREELDALKNRILS